MARIREAKANGEQMSEAQRIAQQNLRRKRFIIFRNEDGSPDWTSLTEEQRRALKMEPDQPAPAVGGPPPPPPAEFPPHMAAMFLNVLVGIETAVVAPRMDLDAAKVRAVLEPSPPLAESIRDCATRVLNKYSGALGAYADEIALASLLVTWQASAFAELRRMKAAEEKKEDKRPPAPDIHFTVEPPTPPKPAPVEKPAAAAAAESAADTIRMVRYPNGFPEPIVRESASDTAGNPFLVPDHEFIGS
jgi:hypothetical protein